MAEVNVKQLPTLCHHDVVRVTIANAQHIGSHTVAGTGQAKCVHGFLESMSHNTCIYTSVGVCVCVCVCVFWKTCIDCFFHNEVFYNPKCMYMYICTYNNYMYIITHMHMYMYVRMYIHVMCIHNAQVYSNMIVQAFQNVL